VTRTTDPRATSSGRADAEAATGRADPAAATAAAPLRSIRACILDADGVLVLRGRPIPGAGEGLRSLERQGIPFRILTNYSSAHRETLATRFGSGGFPVDPGRIVTAASAAAAWTAEAYPGRPLFVLSAPDARREFEGQHLLSFEEAATTGSTAAAVVIGDAGDDLSYRNLDTAFRLIREGAEFLAMHRNPWWLTPKGITLDTGAWIAGLEFALGRRARVLGKPSPLVFRRAAADLARDLGRRRLPARSIAMVGDDLRADLAPAHRLGMRTVLVLTGKVAPDDVDAAIARDRVVPDLVAASIGEVVAALGLPHAPPPAR
jgi:HAD superfamily hydrolase (TIGR01450 family)